MPEPGGPSPHQMNAAEGALFHADTTTALLEAGTPGPEAAAAALRDISDLHGHGTAEAQQEALDRHGFDPGEQEQDSFVASKFGDLEKRATEHGKAVQAQNKPPSLDQSQIQRALGIVQDEKAGELASAPLERRATPGMFDYEKEDPELKPALDLSSDREAQASREIGDLLDSSATQLKSMDMGDTKPYDQALESEDDFANEPKLTPREKLEKQKEGVEQEIQNAHDNRDKAKVAELKHERDQLDGKIKAETFFDTISSQQSARQATKELAQDQADAFLSNVQQERDETRQRVEDFLDTPRTAKEHMQAFDNAAKRDDAAKFEADEATKNNVDAFLQASGVPKSSDNERLGNGDDLPVVDSEDIAAHADEPTEETEPGPYDDMYALMDNGNGKESRFKKFRNRFSKAESDNSDLSSDEEDEQASLADIETEDEDGYLELAEFLTQKQDVDPDVADIIDDSLDEPTRRQKVWDRFLKVSIGTKTLVLDGAKGAGRYFGDAEKGRRRKNTLAAAAGGVLAVGITVAGAAIAYKASQYIGGHEGLPLTGGGGRRQSGEGISKAAEKAQGKIDAAKEFFSSKENAEAFTKYDQMVNSVKAANPIVEGGITPQSNPDRYNQIINDMIHNYFTQSEAAANTIPGTV